MGEKKTMYGMCRGCEQIVPRDEMRSVNINIFGDGVNVIDERVSVRLCPECYDSEYRRWKKLEWQVKMWTGNDIQSDPKLAAKCKHPISTLIR